MTADEDATDLLPSCDRCARPVRRNQADYDLFERMHWACFHYEFEHDTEGIGDPDEACEDPLCPARAFDEQAPEAVWEPEPPE